MKLTTKIGLASLATFVAIAMPLMTIAGWYPNREIRKWDGPNTPGFDHVTFNSFYNTPGYGNETEFFDSAQSANPTYTDVQNVQPGQEIYLRTYVHNGAGPNLNGANFDGPGVARNTTVKIQLPGAVGTAMNAVSQISASNAQPGSVFDTTEFKSANGTPFHLSYVAGSAHAVTRQNANLPLSDNIVTSGALIGESQADGNIPGCFEFAEYVIVKVKVEAVPLTITKTVAHPSQAFVKSVEAKPGDRLYYKIDFNNTANVVQHNLALTDKLPAQVQLIPGTIKLYNAENPNGMALPDNTLFTAGGQSVGDYAAKINGYVLMQVTVKPDATGTFTNSACVRSNEETFPICDTAKVVTPTPPTPPVPPIPPTPTPTPTPGTPSLPATGMESGLAAALGMTGLAGFTRAYRKSKKGLVTTKVNKSR